MSIQTHCHSEITNENVKKERILSLLNNLDIINFITLRKLFGLLHEFAKERNSSVSKMNATNLALVWTPTLFQVDGHYSLSMSTGATNNKSIKEAKPLSTEDVIRIANLNHKLQEIVVLLIQNYDFFFKVRFEIPYLFIHQLHINSTINL
jgi:hypothetical protein